MSQRVLLFICSSLLLICGGLAAQNNAETDKRLDPLSEKGRAELHADIDEALAKVNSQIEKMPKQIDLYSRRGDLYFFRGKFAEAVKDYEKMVELDPPADTSHWRKGIAYFYAERYKDAAHQFEIYHSFDDVDRENGIWRFLSQAKSVGLAEARKGLLKYKKDDREPFPNVYRMFAGEMTGTQVLQRITENTKLDAEEREKRSFYAELYVGLNDFVEGKTESAEKHLRAAVANRWPTKAGYGPNYMWHVGRVHCELLAAEREKK